MNNSTNTISELITVTKPSMPDFNEYVKMLEKIWERKILTNQGPFHEQFEKELSEFLGVKYISVFSNGTIALITALQALGIKGEVITTPFSFVATANSLVWNNIKPVFCDIDPIYGNIDAEKIEALITPQTQAIMPVHVYGNPCDLEKIEGIAKKHSLKVIYDAAHSFAVRKNNVSILNHGDLSILSFHATKVFNTVEGGAIICHDKETKVRIDNLKNFGITNEVTVVEAGINGKMNELQAAFGLLQLKTIETNIEKRKRITGIYRNYLSGIKGLRMLNDIADVKHNYSYFPIFLNNDFPISRDALYEKFKANNILTRRYFYPLITEFTPYKKTNESSNSLPIASKLAKEVLCLPIYSDLTEDNIHSIVSVIKEHA